ncbi:MAG: recombinase family protein [Planctomycetia bacterium]|nr:recombinase family protein [Planctomycetia bacterium]
MSKRRAYSYIRFSLKKQATGGSLDRQTELSRAYCERKKLHLDDTLTLHDLGVSAFRGDNVREGALAGFLEACRTGRVPRGSTLIVESLDRLSRDQIRPALQLFMELQDHGITIVTLQPEREYSPDGTDALALIEPLIVFARAREESEMKAHRRADGWKRARAKARAGGGPLMKTCPAWLDVTAGGFREKPQAVAAVRRIFALACEGLGVHRITAQLTAEGVPAFGKTGLWTKTYVHRILTNPAAMGTHQPNKQQGKSVVPDGAPIPNYYPAVVGEREWQTAQSALQSRGGDFDASGKFRRGGKGVRGSGRKGKGEPNLFTGLLHCALTGERMNIVHAMGRKTDGERLRYRYLMQTQESGKAHGPRLSYPVFEDSILSALTELDPADIADSNGPTNGRKAEIAQLSGRLLDIDNRLERTRQRARTTGDFDAFLDLIADLQAEKKQVSERRAELQHEADSGAASSLGETQSLVEVLRNAKPENREELRRRLRVRIGQLVSGIWLVVVRRGRRTVVGVQMYFRGSDRRRDYLILHVAGNRYADGYTLPPCSLADAVKAGDRDLRKRADAKKLASILEAIDLKLLETAMRG